MGKILPLMMSHVIISERAAFKPCGSIHGI